MTGRGKPRSARSASAPALQVTCGSYSRERSRETDIGYERGKDRVTHWIGAWNFNQVCSVLQSLVTRCPLNQLEYLWTALESVPHRDFQQSAEGRHRGLLFLPLSTPLSRELRTRLNRSRKTENKRLYRVQSAHIHDELVHTYPPPLPQSQSEAQLPRSPFPPESTPQWRLPGLRPSPSPSYPLTRPHSTLPPTSRPISIRWQSSTRQSGRMLVRSLSTPPSRILSPMRRHMTASSPREIISALETDTRTPPPLLPQRVFLPSSPSTPLPHGGESPLSPEALQFLSWFTDLEKDWQQQEVLQLVVWNLDQRELYFLTALLMSRRYRDFLAHLPESLAVQVLSHIPPKDILRHCCRVSHVWSVRCSSETLWREKCQQGQLGLPMVNVLSWKRLFVDDLRLKRNWRKGRCTTRPLLGHSKRVLCVRMRDGLVATGSADRSIRVWSLDNGECLHTLQGHLRSVWCLCFYGKNLLISGSSDSSIRIWNFRTGVCERTLEGHSGPVWSVQLKKEVLISGSHDKTPHLLTPRAQLKWRQCAHLPNAMVFAQAVAIGETVYFGSGTSTIGEAPTDCPYKIFKYESTQNKWSPIPECPVVGFGMADFMGRLTLVGGAYGSPDDSSSSPCTLTNEIHTLEETGEWKKLIPPMPTARLLPTAFSHGPSLVSCGGIVLDASHDVCVRTVEVFSSENSQWYRASPLPLACIGMTSTIIRDHCYLLGGFTDTEFDHPTKLVYTASLSMLVRDAQTRQRLLNGGIGPSPSHIWQSFPEAPRYASTAAHLGGCLLALGGSDERLEHKSRAVHVYSPLTDSWIRIEDIPVECFACAVARLPAGDIILIGGMGHDEEDALKTVYRGRICVD